MEKTTVRFRVSGQELTMVGNYHRFASNSVGLVRIEVEPSDEWLSFDSVDCIFQNDQDRTTMTMFYEFGTYACMAPASMLSRISKVLINLSGKNMVDGDLVERLTTYPTLAFVIDVSSNVANYRETVIPANQYEQFVKLVGRQANKLADVEVSAHESDVPEVLKTFSPDAPMSLDFGLVSGAAAGFGAATASIDDNIGTPSVEVTTSGPDTAKVFDFAFSNMKGDTGEKGDTGDAAGFGTVSATVDANHGTPAVTVTTSGDDTAKNFAFDFKNLQPAPYDDSVIQARMDSFTNLAEGSTTGDAELIDGRVGADGVTYTNIGGAIRGQITDLKSDINDIAVKSASGSYVPIIDGAPLSNLQQAVLNVNYSSTRKSNAKLKVFGKNWLTITGSSQTISGVTFTINSDGSVLANGTATALIDFIIDDLSQKSMYPANTAFILSGSPENVDTTKYMLRAYTNYANYIDTGHGVEIPNLTEGSTRKVSIVIYEGTTMNNVLFKPMLTLKSQFDGIWESPQQGAYSVNFSSMNPYFYGGTIDFLTGKITSLYDSSGNLLETPVVYNATVTASGVTLPVSLLNGITNFIGLLYTNVASGTLDIKYLISIIDTKAKLAVVEELTANIENKYAEEVPHIYNGDYTLSMKKTGGVALSSYSVGDVVDLSNLSTSGEHYTVLIKNVCAGEKYYLNITDGSSSRPWAFLDKDYKLISMASDAYATTTELTAPLYAKYLLIQCGSVHYANAKVVRFYSFTEQDKNIGIDYLNHYSDMIEKLENASNSAKNDTSTAIKSRANLLNLVHFSDIHGSVNNIRRILEFCDLYNMYISDIIHTGDSPTTYYGDANPFATVGGDEVLNVIGNHDCWIQGDTWPSPYNATAQQVYEKFFAPYIAEWGVTSAGANLCYYYKDYSTANVRLIVLDALHYNSAQEAWFESVLADAITEGLRVVAVTHYPAQTGLTGINCTFNSLTTTINSAETPPTGEQFERMPESAFTAVDAFISNGGEFVCWLSGHSHDDYIGVVKEHINQIQILVSCASTSNKYSDCARTNLTKTQDLFNVFTVDGNSKLIKLIRVGSTMDKFMRKRETLCINYETKEVISNN